MNAVRTAAAEFLDRLVGGVLGAAAAESGQDLLGFGGAQLQRPGVLDHLVVLLADEVPADGPRQDRFQARVRGAIARAVQARRADVLQPGQQPVAEQVGEGEPDEAGLNPSP